MCVFFWQLDWIKQLLCPKSLWQSRITLSPQSFTYSVLLILCSAACVGWAGCMAQPLDAPGERDAGSCGGAARSSPPPHGPTHTASAALPKRSADGRATHCLPQQGQACYDTFLKPTVLNWMQGFWKSVKATFSLEILLTTYFFLCLRSLPVSRSLKIFCTVPPAGWMKPSHGLTLPAHSLQPEASIIMQKPCRSETPHI